MLFDNKIEWEIKVLTNILYKQCIIYYLKMWQHPSIQYTHILE